MRAFAFMALACVTLAAGCRKHEEQASVSPATASNKPPPPDRLAKEETLEGTLDAMGIKLPHGYKESARYPDVVKARGPLSIKELRRYVEARVRDGVVRSQGGDVLFDRVRVRENPLRDLAVRIDYDRDEGGTVIEVRDLTTPPVPDLPNDEARYRAAGFQRNGQLLDPLRTE